MVGCDVLRNTSKDFAVVDGIAEIAENDGALCDVFWAPWHPRHVASANRFPVAGSPTCWPKAKEMFARRSGALHANKRTGIIWRSLRRERISSRPEKSGRGKFAIGPNTQMGKTPTLKPMAVSRMVSGVGRDCALPLPSASEAN